ncbi:metallophosphoesterase family protein [Paenibacillus contaminans]|uniref:DNA repair exonuclease n=1 Tax=Paenibacillus contaminans TaxID=450362 RepID=A0A329LMI3_9BACL|nr:DNA repair exonuclease [Paenibacillus contaminans]RAV08460.1 DNA repair exonuclease [Paenibacillus contaminans]
MPAFRFIHAADLHLDSPFRGMAGLPDSIRETVRRSTFDALDALVDLAEREHADFILIAGDVYDAADRSLRAQLRLQKAMRRLAGSGIPAYVIHGNHDPDDGRAARLDWPDTVRFFSSREPESMLARSQSGEVLARIYGMSYRTAAVTDNLAARYGHIPDAPYHIALLHTNVDGDPAHDNYAPCTLRELLLSRMDYWALGHIHTRRVLHESPFIVYSGNTQGRSVRETGAKGCYVVDVTANGSTALSFRALDAVRWFQTEVSIEDTESDQALKDKIERDLERIRLEAEGRPAIVRLSLTGRGPLHTKLTKAGYLEELAAEFREAETERAAYGAFVWLESVKRRTSLEADREALLAQSGFLGDLLRMCEELLADEEKLEQFCGEAAAALLDNPRAAKYAGVAFGADERREWLWGAQQLAIDLLADAEGRDAP